MHNAKRMIAAIKDVQAAERAAQEVAFEEYPVGGLIEWERGKGVQCGTILGLHFRNGLRLRVRNVRTGKEYWITFYDVTCALGDEIKEQYLAA